MTEPNKSHTPTSNSQGSWWRWGWVFANEIHNLIKTIKEHSWETIYKELGFPELGRVEPVIFERIFAGSSGAPIEVSRKGKAPPLERGRGKAFPTCEPDRVTAEAF